MALKIVDTASLDAVANALNESAGTTGAISFPDGFVEKIGELSSSKLAERIDGTITELTQKDFGNATAIISYSFYNCLGLVSVEMSDTIEVIGSNVFAWCENMVNCKCSNNARSIGYSAFNGCKGLESVVLPEVLTSIGYSAFEDCRALKSISIPKGVTVISRRLLFNALKLEVFDLTAYSQGSPLPTLEDISAFTDAGIRSPSGTFKIIVPHGRKSTLAGMTNWSSFADKIVEAE